MKQIEAERERNSQRVSALRGASKIPAIIRKKKTKMQSTRRMGAAACWKTSETAVVQKFCRGEGGEGFLISPSHFFFLERGRILSLFFFLR